MRSKLAIFSVAALTLIATGCSQESDEDRKISEAISCLDRASTMAQADVCQSKVDGMTSEASYLIRCSANFIAQGITGTTLAQAFKQLNQTPAAGSTQSAAMLSFLVFTKPSTLNSASVTLYNCQRSGVRSSIGLASMISAASAVGDICQTVSPAICPTGVQNSPLDPTNPATFDPTKLEQVATDLYNSGNTAAKQAIGQAAISAQASLCGTGSSLSTQDICTRLNSAVTQGAGNTADIGQALLNLIVNP